MAKRSADVLLSDGSAVHLRQIDVGLPLKQRAQRRPVAFHHRVGDLARHGSRHQAGHRQDEHGHRDEDSMSIHWLPPKKAPRIIPSAA